MNRLMAALVVASTIVGAIVATFYGWRSAARIWQRPKERRWRFTLYVVALAAVTLSLFFFVTYATWSALIGGDRHGGPTTLLFIRAGNYLSLFGALVSLGGEGKTRWAAFLRGCLMLFLWFSEGMSL
jgi:hypothetical protein